MSKFDFQENNYFLNDKCIASSLTQVDETLSDLLVPSLKLVRTELCVASADVIAMSSDIYRNADSPVLSSRGLSGKVEFLLSSDKKAMDYGGTLRCIDPGEERPYVLSSFLADNFGPDAFLKHGFTFRISSDQVFYPTATASAYVFSENDYFIINRDTFVKNVSSADVDIIYDASVEGLLLSSRLDELSVRTIADINYLSSTLSATVKVRELFANEEKTIEQIAAEYQKDHWNIGDIIIVKRPLYDGAALYSYSGYAYDGTKWCAMDGNYSAENVYFTKDFALDGEYTTVGNIKKSDLSVQSKGRNVQWLFDKILDTTIMPVLGANPSIKMSLDNSGTYEPGTKITPKYTITYTQGKYKYTWRTSPDEWDGTTFKQATVSDSQESMNITSPGQHTFTREITVVENQSYTLKASNIKYNDGKVPVNSKGALVPEVQRKGGSLADITSSNSIIGSYKCFYGYISPNKPLPESDPEKHIIDGSKVDSDTIRKLPQSEWNAQVGKTVINTVKGVRQFVYCASKTKKYKEIYVTQSSPVIENIQLKKTDVNVLVEGNSTPYTMFYYAEGEGLTNDGVTFTITKIIKEQ